jgi:homoaconitase/3-isopropylmalate dehydratase large subunit
MGMTMSQKILANHSGRTEVIAGELGPVKLDLVLGSDVTTPIALMELKNMGCLNRSILKKSCWSWTILPPIKISRLLGIVQW